MRVLDSYLPVFAQVSPVQVCLARIVPPRRHVGVSPHSGHSNGVVPLTVTLTHSSTDATSYLWDYGDGITSTTSAVTHTHTYTARGVYTLSLTATGPGGTDTLTRTSYITVSFPAHVIFADDFERANSTNLGSDWIEEDGDWDITSGRLHATLSTITSSVGTAATYTHTHYVIETELMVDDLGTPGLTDVFGLAFAIDPNDWTGYGVFYNPFLG